MEKNGKQGCGCRNNRSETTVVTGQIPPPEVISKKQMPIQVSPKQEALIELIKAVHARKSKISNRFQK